MTVAFKKFQIFLFVPFDGFSSFKKAEFKYRMTFLGYALTVLNLLNSSKGCLILLKSSDYVSYNWETIYANALRI